MVAQLKVMETKDAVSMIQLKKARCQKALSLEQQNWYAERYRGLIEMNIERMLNLKRNFLSIE